MNFFTKIKAFFTNLFGGKTEFNLEIKVEEGDVSTPNTEEVPNTDPIIEMAPECDEHVPSKTIVLKESPQTFFKVEDTKIESVKEIKSKSRTRKEKEESQSKETKEKKSKKKA